MLTIQNFRELLPEPDRSNLSDAEVKRIRDIGYGFADAIFDKWIKERNQWYKSMLTKDKDVSE